MLWLVLIASGLGFLAVTPLLTQPSLHNWMTPTATNLSLWQNFGLASGLLLVTLLLIGFLSKRHFFQKNSFADDIVKAEKVKAEKVKEHNFLPNRCGLGQALLRKVGYLLLPLVVLFCSVSTGIYQQLRYQQSLLIAPVTLTATVSVKQISDTITTQFGTGEKSIVVGNGYPRQIWQITGVDDATVKLPLPMTVMVTANVNDHPEWLESLNQLAPGNQVKVKLALQPIRQPQVHNLPNNVSVVNLGFDEALWLQTNQVQATAQLLSVDKQALPLPNHTSVEYLRWQLRQKLLHQIHQTLLADNLDNLVDKTEATEITNTSVNDAINSHAILLGLLTGDKALMSRDIKHLYQVTGISHLLAISGPHVLMLASVVSLLLLGLIKRCLPNMLQHFPSRLILLWVSVVVAGFYALLVGFELPAQRTFWMLVWLTLASQLLIDSRPYRVLAWVALLMMWLDPIAVRQAGFWLSFVAVALLVDFSTKQTDKGDAISLWQISSDATAVNNWVSRSKTLLKHIWQQLWTLFELQLRLFVLMLPVVGWFFGKVSLISVLVNLVAVPLLGLVVVPLDMLAGVLSWLPLGDALSQGVWSLLAGLLTVFHHGLLALVQAGWAKQWFVALSHAQLLLVGLMVLIVLGRGLVPRLLLLPLVGMVLALSFASVQKTQALPSLTVMDNPTMGISLLVQGSDAWLILAEQKPAINAINAVNAPKATKAAKPKNHPFGKTQAASQTASQTAGLSSPKSEQWLEQIRQLLAHSQVTRLTGVISQTPSQTSHQLVQTLATDIPIRQYWLAGFDPLHPDEIIQTTSDTQITPSPCQVGKVWQNNGLTVKALSGWQLELPLTAVERQASQTCMIQISHQPANNVLNHSFNALITAGNSAIPMQMSGKLCQVGKVDLLIHPYQTPFERDWLDLTSPTQLHLITGQQDYQNLTEAANIALLGFANQHPVTVLHSQTFGTLRYQLSDQP